MGEIILCAKGRKRSEKIAFLPALRYNVFIDKSEFVDLVNFYLVDVIYKESGYGMTTEIEEYFIQNKDATFITKDGRLCLQSVDRDGNLRISKAIEQAKLKPVALDQVIRYVNEFLDMLCDKCSEDNCEKRISLQGKEFKIIDHGIYVEGCRWEAPIWDDTKKQYISYDEKYVSIQQYFNLKSPNDIVWLKFTDDGYLGVVADSFDINFDVENTSGKLLEKLTPEKKWNDNIVIIFPITPKMLETKTRKKIETGIGNYLISKGVPIIDFYSHNNF